MTLICKIIKESVCRTTVIFDKLVRFDKLYWGFKVGFEKNYFTAKNKFLELVNKANFDKIIEVKIEGVDPEGNELTTVIAIKYPEAKKILIHSSGIHGVEGFAGSAVQCKLIETMDDWVTKDICVIFIHIVNPWGMAWKRRVNKNNVDLNRNFIIEGNHEGIPDNYENISPWLNKKSPPKFSDLYWVNAILLLIKYGNSKLKQCIAEGQYENKNGIFYGGKKLEKEFENILDSIGNIPQNKKFGLIIDFHTGLGKFGVDSLIVSEEGAGFKIKDLKEFFGLKIEEASTEGVSYTNRGGYPEGMMACWKNVKWAAITQEFGTFGEKGMLKTMIEENRLSQWSKLTEKELLNHPIRIKFANSFNPQNEKWRVMIIEEGTNLFKQGIKFLNSK